MVSMMVSMVSNIVSVMMFLGDFSFNLSSVTFRCFVAFATAVTGGSVSGLRFDDHSHFFELRDFFDDDFLSFRGFFFHDFFLNNFGFSFFIDLSSEFSDLSLESQGLAVVDFYFFVLVVLLNFSQLFFSQFKHANKSLFLFVEIVELLLKISCVDLLTTDVDS